MPTEQNPNLTRFRIRPFRHSKTGRAMWGLQRDRGRGAPNVFIFAARDIPRCFEKIKRIAAVKSRAKPFYPEH